MTQQNQQQQKAVPAPRMNQLIPMSDPTDGDARCFVNAWDVKSRENDGFKVVGDKAKHLSSVKAPTDALKTKRDEIVTMPNGAIAANAAEVAKAERARIRAIQAAAGEGQDELVDSLIESGVTVADATKALKADAAARKPKRAGAIANTPPAPAAPSEADAKPAATTEPAKT